MKRLAAVGIFVLLLVCIVLYFLSVDNASRNEGLKSLQIQKDDLPSLKVDQPDIGRKSKNPELEKIDQDKMDFVVTQQHEQGLSENQPIEFYGKVIDQYGEPISGVGVIYEIRQYNVSFLERYLKRDTTNKMHNTLPFQIATDSDGRFYVADIVGSRLLVKDLRKEGYLQEFENRYFDFYQTKRPDTKKEQPFIFTLWKESTGEAITNEVEKIRKILLQTETVGRSEHSINFQKKKVMNGFVDGADLFVEIFNEGRGDQLQRRSYDWMVKIIVPNGGIKQTTDTFLFEADVDEYTSEISFEMFADNEALPGVSEVQRSKFYVHTGEGKYVSFYLDVITGSRTSVYLEDILFGIPTKKQQQQD
jgi:hypothetical protein